MNFADLLTTDIRLAILQILESDPDYTHNGHIIKTALAQLGHNISTDKVATELHWLSENGLVTLQQNPVLVAKLTSRGEDVALGRVLTPGVARPRPE